jgi:hypothetical protein
LPPHTTSFFFVVTDAVAEADAMVVVTVTGGAVAAVQPETGVDDPNLRY